MVSMEIKPAIKWAGGKRQLLEEIEKRAPYKYNNYFEPFVGGGAVVFHLQPKQATINDINEQLINLYVTIRENPEELIIKTNKITETVCNEEIYATNREKYNARIRENILDIDTASLFLWLNKYCFNGLYRVNSKGEFNVTYNGRTEPVSIDSKNILNMSRYLQGVNILCGDFEHSLSGARNGDFIFIDSPYDSINGTSFDTYAKDGFSVEGHKRLSETYKRLDNAGCYCMLTNHDTTLIRQLYREYNIEALSVKRSINSDSGGRNGCETEIIVTNYDTEVLGVSDF